MNDIPENNEIKNENEIEIENEIVFEFESENLIKKPRKLMRRLGVIMFALFCGAALLVTALKEFGPARKAEKVPFSTINLYYLFFALAAFIVSMLAESAKYYFMIRDVTGKKMPWLAYKVAILIS